MVPRCAGNKLLGKAFKTRYHTVKGGVMAWYKDEPKTSRLRAQDCGLLLKAFVRFCGAAEHAVACGLLAYRGRALLLCTGAVACSDGAVCGAVR